MPISQLTAFSPIDGRYYNDCRELEGLCNEFGLIKLRLTIEVKWLETLASNLCSQHYPPLSAAAKNFLQGLINAFNEEDAEAIKKIEKTINHDTKAVEYFLKEKFTQHHELKNYIELIHFGCTSEDINNLAYALLLKTVREKFLHLDTIITILKQMAHEYAAIPMLARTHGQPATPTTIGKEFANFATRLQKQFKLFAAVQITGKINGAVGNYNAFYAAFPALNWLQISQNFVEQLGLTWNPYTTQIESHDAIVDYCHHLAHINSILINLNRDIWGYTALGYLLQKIQKNEVGSSTMPHKINPIDFENSEGNLGIANALLYHFAEKLPISRWQRDLSDSTVLRNLAVAIIHSILAYKSLIKGLNKIEINLDQIHNDLANHWEVIAEAIQTVMRSYKIPNSYEQLKTLTRGQKIDQSVLQEFIVKLPLPDEVKQNLLQLTPFNYLGMAKELAKNL
jgi:adenylosuccinate lyase